MTEPKIIPLEGGVHRTTVRVRFGDTDPYGIVYFVNYFRYCHRAIEEFLRVCGLKPEETFKNVQEGFGLPIVEAWGRFRRPAKYGELLRIETRIQEIRPKPLFSASSFILKPAGSSWRKAPPTWWPLTQPGGCGTCRNWSKVPYLRGSESADGRVGHEDR